MEDNFQIGTWAIILATFIGPIAAVQSQKWIEKSQAAKNRKLWIFQTLMATRSNVVSDRHVEALNSITSRKGKSVLKAWKVHHDNLCNHMTPSELISLKRHDSFIEILHEMSVFLGYDFDRVSLKRGCYTPQFHGTRESIQEMISIGLAEILSGSKPLPVRIISMNILPENTENVRQTL
jgi:hypothetical protein